MKLRITFVFFLLASCAPSFADAGDDRKMPDQYAEAVLDVQGMI